VSFFGLTRGCVTESICLTESLTGEVWYSLVEPLESRTLAAHGIVLEQDTQKKTFCFGDTVCREVFSKWVAVYDQGFVCASFL